MSDFVHPQWLQAAEYSQMHRKPQQTPAMNDFPSMRVDEPLQPGSNGYPFPYDGMTAVAPRAYVHSQHTSGSSSAQQFLPSSSSGQPFAYPSTANDPSFVFGRAAMGAQEAPLDFSPSAQTLLPPQVSSVPPRATKRPRELPLDPPDEGAEEEDNEAAKQRPQGACQRCKTLKVKCEFLNDTDPCRRCLNGSHECKIPGRRKRRVPPKREHLLAQIRDQAEQIKNLLQQLQKLKAQTSQNNINTAEILSPAPSTDTSSSAASPLLGLSSPMLINHEIESWLSQARESMNQLMHVYRDLPKSLITDEDQEESSNGTYDYDSEAEQDDVVVQDQDGHFFIHPAPSADSGLTDGSPVPSGHRQRKKDSQAGAEAAGLPNSAVPFGLMANVAKEMSRLRVDDQETSGNDAIGVASNAFFKSASSLGWEAPAKPAILTSQIVSPVEAEKLFRIYFDKMNLSLSTLDPVLYTAAKTCYRSPFLFTVICAIASRFYTERPELYHELMNHARSLAGQALIKGPKTVDMCHAFILLALYPVPGKRWEDDNSWIYLGMAIRVAIDLNLQYPPSHEPADEMRARELLNRTRVWINCYNLDRSTGSQYGRPPVINQMDYVANHSEDWWRSSKYNLASFDIHLCAYNADLRIMSEFRAKIYSNPNHPTLLNKDVDLESLATETDEKLKKVGDIWLARLEQGDMGNPQHCFRTDLIRLAYSYARLAVLSYGFQHAFGKSDSDENPFLLRCLTAAMDVVRVFTKEVGRPEQRVFVRHGPEAQSVFVTFASAFLIKLLQPKFASYLSVGQRSTIIRSVQSVVELLGSSEIALDDRHSPKLYSSFLQGLLGKVDRAESRRHQKKASSSTAAASSSSRRTPSKDFSQATEHEATASNHSSPGSEPLVPPANSAPLSGSLDQFAPPSAINDVFMFDFDFPVPTPMSDQGFFYPQLPFDEAIKENARMLGLSSDFFAQSNFANGANGDYLMGDHFVFS